MPSNPYPQPGAAIPFTDVVRVSLTAIRLRVDNEYTSWLRYDLTGVGYDLTANRLVVHPSTLSLQFLTRRSRFAR